eukprot:CAMPEP_0116891402 /NCGR_PEP_ID=MMETSP0467-20121206/1827_1 /TAXON_ID=283647 /ORGANISM="Mesodinium pulex, Strain SPMC105" /LENGTH=62 /DNA_ID=CAMNT_0004559899 /DNA_START=341 /DNA_END=529 /DNA_ORIENTATION=+
MEFETTGKFEEELPNSDTFILENLSRIFVDEEIKVKDMSHIFGMPDPKMKIVANNMSHEQDF